MQQHNIASLGTEASSPARRPRSSPKEIWAIGIRLQIEHRTCEPALFDLGIDRKLRACDLVKLRVRDACHGDQVARRAIVLQQKTQRPVQFEIAPPPREAVEAWTKQAGLKSDDYLFPSRIYNSPHPGTREYARILDSRVEKVGLDPAGYEHIRCGGPRRH